MLNNILCDCHIFLILNQLNYGLKKTLQFLPTDCSTCQTNKLEGDSLTFNLTDRPLKDDDRFIIKKDNKLLVPKRNRKQEGPGIIKNDFLELQNVKLNDSGTYTVEAFDVKGIKIKSYSEHVCVYGKTFGIINAISLKISLSLLMYMQKIYTN